MGRWSYEAVCHAPESVRKTLFAEGTKPRFSDLVGWEFRGYNPPLFAKVAGIQRFIKGFYQWGCDKPPEEVDRIYGYNLFCDPRAPQGVWRALPDELHPRRHGFYDVYDPPPGPLRKHPNALLIDYGVPENHGLNPERLIRDYLVQVNPDDPTIFLGKAYLKLGPVFVHTNFFVLERYRPHSYRP